LPFAVWKNGSFLAKTTLVAEGVAQAEGSRFWSNILHPELILAAARECSIQAVDGSEDNVAVAEQLKRDLKLNTGPGSAPTEVLAEIFFTSNIAETSIQFLGVLAKSAVAHAHAVPAGTSQLDDEVDRARLELEQAQEELLAFRAQLDIAKANAAGQPTRASASTGDNAKINPQWKNLDDEYRSALAYRKDLLSVASKNHPRVRNVEAELVRLEHELAKTPKYLENDSSDESTNPAEAAISESDSAKLSQLQAAVDRARRRYQQVQSSQSTASAETVSARIVREPFLLRESPGDLTKTRLAMMVGLSGLVGLLAASYVRIVQRDRVLWDEVDVERATGLPVLASVFPSRTKPKHRERLTGGNPWFVRWSVRVCEALLVGFVIFIVYCCVAQTGFATRLRTDPISAYVEAVHKLLMRS
jgi:hypothetical protein